MGPSNEHELEIAREVDKYSARDELGADTAPKVLAFLDFELLERDYYFMKEYIRWRMANPIAK